MLLLHKLSSRLFKAHIPLFPKVIKALIYFLYNCVIPPECSIGEGTKLYHSGLGIVIHPNSVIGKNCNIYNHVVLGGGHDGPDGPPVRIVVENNVVISAGAKVLCKTAPLIIGQNSTIGANAVVFENVPPNAVVAGVPAKIISFKTAIDNSDRP